MELISSIPTFIPIFLLLGLGFFVFYDKLVDSLPEIEENRFNWGERLTFMVLWPFAVIVFLYYFFAAFFSDDE